jgi:hypothetical protein
LISDLAALIDAGLVVVHEPVLGPARYAIAPVAESQAAYERRAAPPRRHHAVLT